MRKNAAAITRASRAIESKKQAKLEEGRAQIHYRRASARPGVSSSGYGTPTYTPRCEAPMLEAIVVDTCISISGRQHTTWQ